MGYGGLPCPLSGSAQRPPQRDTGPSMHTDDKGNSRRAGVTIEVNPALLKRIRIQPPDAEQLIPVVAEVEDLAPRVVQYFGRPVALWTPGSARCLTRSPP